MSRRNQSRRRRNYGRRQHEVRERRVDQRPESGWLSDAESAHGDGWPATDAIEDHGSFGEPFAGYGR